MSKQEESLTRRILFSNAGLYVISRVYGIAASIRNVLYDVGIFRTYRPPVKVVSIGNLTAGGNAKTPLCMYLAEELHKNGYKPVILARGYKGKIKGPYIVKEEDPPQEVGDEPCMMTHAVDFPVVICRNKARGARFIAKEKLGDLIILDDGFQHRRLARDVDIVSVNVGSKRAIGRFLGGQLLPLGRFREPRTAGLKRADMLVFSERGPLATKSELDPRLFEVLPSDLHAYRSYVSALGIFSLDESQKISAQDFVAFCGIANPNAFYRTLKEIGCTIVFSMSFRDHHSFKKADIEKLKANFPNVPLVCTEKDAVKLKAQPIEGVYWLKVKTSISPEDTFINQILGLLRKE